MRIEQLLYPIEAYLNSRAAILRALDKRALTCSELGDMLLVKYSVLARRRQNAAHWRPDELGKVAQTLRLPAEGIVGLQTVALRLMSLPDGVRSRLLKDARLSSRKLQVRLQDYTFWQYDELEQLASTCRKWQDTKRLDILLACSNRLVSDPLLGNGSSSACQPVDTADLRTC
ncbi:hypothetical protein [uncultured Fibrella sp.]|uniref:hypothetical protein n=1 Tax=uncultured Fibrella sp. TaxID=1284596 RepID=UPI0035CAE895